MVVVAGGGDETVVDGSHDAEVAVGYGLGTDADGKMPDENSRG